MNVNTAGAKDIELAGKGDGEEYDHGHTHEKSGTHYEDEECGLATDTRTVNLDQGMGQAQND